MYMNNRVVYYYCIGYYHYMDRFISTLNRSIYSWLLAYARKSVNNQ